LYDIELPFVSKELPGIGGIIRDSYEDFIVEEVPVFEPSGNGEHLFVNLTKRGLSTRKLALDLSAQFGLSRTGVGFAGLKDVRSISTQTFSLHLGRISNERIDKIAILIEKNHSVKVNWLKPHDRKLRAGQLLGNIFNINITELSVDSEEALQRGKNTANFLERKGLPNFYGPQRVDYENIKRGFQIIKGKHKGRLLRDKWLRRLLISSYLNHLCNLYLKKRLERGKFYHLIKGDIAKKHLTGGVFLVKDPEAENMRYEKGEISFTAPIYGPRMWWAEGFSGDLEKEIFSESDITLNELKSLDVRGSRRLGRIIPKITIQKSDHSLNARFFLPKGAYATVVLREIMKKEVR
jgi:tRNA pseudouridine13 synthase